MSNPVRPHRRQPTRLHCPSDSPGKNTGVGCHFLLQCMKLKSESEVAQSCLTLATLWTAAYQAPPSTGFSRQKYWSRVPTVNKMVRKAVLGCNVKNDRMISVCFQGKPFNITVIQVYALTSNAEEAQIKQFYEDI